MCYIKNIENPLKIPIEIKELYNDIYEYLIPDGYFFESFGCSYGQAIYGGKELSNHYIIKERKKEEDGTIH